MKISGNEHCPNCGAKSQIITLFYSITYDCQNCKNQPEKPGQSVIMDESVEFIIGNKYTLSQFPLWAVFKLQSTKKYEKIDRAMAERDSSFLYKSYLGEFFVKRESGNCFQVADLADCILISIPK